MKSSGRRTHLSVIVLIGGILAMIFCGTGLMIAGITNLLTARICTTLGVDLLISGLAFVPGLISILKRSKVN